MHCHSTMNVMKALPLMALRANQNWYLPMSTVRWSAMLMIWSETSVRFLCVNLSLQKNYQIDKIGGLKNGTHADRWFNTSTDTEDRLNSTAVMKWAIDRKQRMEAFQRNNHFHVHWCLSFALRLIRIYVTNDSVLNVRAPKSAKTGMPNGNSTSHCFVRRNTKR